MTIKILGGFFIIVSSYFFGIIKYKELLDELNIMKAFYDCVLYIKNEIAFSKTPFIEIISQLSEKNCYLQDFYINFLKKAEEGCDAEELWKNCIDDLDIGVGKKEILKKLSQCFSTVDIDGQTSKLTSYINEIEGEISKSEKYIEKNKKLYKNSGLYAGIIVAVLLI